LLNAAYFFPIVVRAFLSRDLKNEKYGEASAWVVAPLCLTAALAVAFGIFPDLIAPIFTLAEIIAAEIMQLAPT
jgi:multicomponent Na+:H+ antiporter subunit D